jgi:hypothetical protein
MSIGETVVVGQTISVLINATLFSYTPLTGNTRAVVASALAAVINAGAEPVTAVARANGQIKITHDTAGTFTASVTAGNAYMLGSLRTVLGSKQPVLSAMDREMLPAAFRENEAVKVYTDASVFGVDEQNQRMADVFEFDGGLGQTDEFEVVRVYPFQMGQLDHNKCYAVRRVRGSAVV